MDECIVYGKPDDLLGERVVADIVVNNNFCKHEFENHKIMSDYCSP